jgi:transposase
MCKYNAKVMLIVKVKGYDYKIRKVFIYNIFTELCELKGEACRRYIFLISDNNFGSMTVWIG